MGLKCVAVTIEDSIFCLKCARLDLIPLLMLLKLHVHVIPSSLQARIVSTLGPLINSAKVPAYMLGTVMRDVAVDLGYPLKSYWRKVATTHDCLAKVIDAVI